MHSLRELMQDLTYAFRRLRRTGFVSAGVVLLMAIGILYGVNLIDVPAIAAALLLICTASFMSAVIPWLRATRTNPAVILQED